MRTRGKRFYITIGQLPNNNTLHGIISRHLKHLSNTRIRQLILNGNVYINKKRNTDPDSRVPKNVTISVYQSLRNCSEVKSLTLDDIIYQDPYILAVNKPAGMPSDTVREGQSGTLPFFLERLFPEIKYMQILHRLDKGTSGIVLVSLKRFVTKHLSAQFRNREIYKWYAAVSEGLVTSAPKRINSHLIRHPRDPRKMQETSSSQPGSKQALTDLKVLALHRRFNRSSLLVRPVTGRMHQIRVHLASMGHPIVGDRLYGARDKSPRMLLHAMAIIFTHPFTHNTTRIICPPDHFFQIDPECSPLFHKIDFRRSFK